MWERGHPSIGGGSADLYSHCGNHMHSLRKLGRDTLWGTNPEGASSYLTDTHSSMFIAALFITARNWKQPSCPSALERRRGNMAFYTIE